jgi:hypothetical protein
MNEKCKCDMKKSPNQAPVYSNSADHSFINHNSMNEDSYMPLKTARLPETVTAG